MPLPLIHILPPLPPPAPQVLSVSPSVPSAERVPFTVVIPETTSFIAPPPLPAIGVLFPAAPELPNAVGEAAVPYEEPPAPV